MKINEVEKLTGMTKKAIRFYEEQDLISPARAENGYRDYSEQDVKDLQEIRFLRRLQIPVDSIRKVKEGKLSLEECMNLHVARMEKSKATIEMAKDVCMEIASSGENLSEIEFDKYEDYFKALEEGGFRMRGIEEFNKKKWKGAKIGAIVFAAIMVLVEAVIVVAQVADPMPWGLFIIISVLILLPIIGIIWALYARRKELKEGEEYEAFKY